MAEPEDGGVVEIPEPTGARRLGWDMGYIPYIRHILRSIRASLMREMTTNGIIMAFTILMSCLAFLQGTTITYFKETANIWAAQYQFSQTVTGNE